MDNLYKLFRTRKNQRSLNFLKSILSKNDDLVILVEDAEIDLGGFNQIVTEPYCNFSLYQSFTEVTLHLDEHQSPLLLKC